MNRAKQYTNNKWVWKVFASASFLLLPAFAVAQVSINNLEEGKKKPTLIPNLSVHFTLNSALSSEETDYYKAIVEELLRNIPKQVDLSGEHEHLLSGSNRYDKLRVVSYLPDVEQLEDDPTARDISFFDIQFEKADPAKLKRLMRKDETLYNSSVFVRTDKLEAFMRKVNAIRGGEELDGLPNTQTSGDLENQSISTNDLLLAKPLAPVETAPVETVAVNAAAVEVAKSTAEPTPKPTPVAKPAPKVKAEPKKIPVPPVAPKVVVKQLTPTFLGDLIEPRGVTDAQFAQFAKDVQKAGVLDMVIYTTYSPFIDADSLVERRKTALKEKLTAQGVNWDALKHSEIRLQGANQRVQLYAGRKSI